MYFAQKFPLDYKIAPNTDLVNAPFYVQPPNLEKLPAPGKPLDSDDFELFVEAVSTEIARMLDLKKI
jgi:threonine synthase